MGFQESLEIANTLLSPKIGVSVKIYGGDQEEDKDRLSMFGIVEMYENAMAQLYVKVERMSREKMLTIETLQVSVNQRNEQIQEMILEHREKMDSNLNYVASVEQEKDVELSEIQKSLEEKDVKIEALSSEIHTLKL